MTTGRISALLTIVLVAAALVAAIGPANLVRADELTVDGSFALAPAVDDGTALEGVGLQAAQTTRFTFSGIVKRGATPVTAICSFRLSLWDAVTGGSGVGSLQTVNNVPVTNGFFSLEVAFGNVFRGQARWVQVATKCGAEAVYTASTPRQPAPVAAYALGLRPGTRIEGNVPSGATFEAGLRVTNGSTDYPIAVFGIVTDTSGPAIGVAGNNASTHGYGVYGFSSGGGIGVRGEASGYGIGVWGSSSGNSGVYGISSSASGVFASSASGNGVSASSSSGNGLKGSSNTAWGVDGRSTSNIGVYGQSYAAVSAGVFGTSPYIGVQGTSSGSDPNRQAVRGDNAGSATGYAGFFYGNTWVFGTLTKNAGAFRIDHPLDPENKYLSHSFVESPDMKNIYDGVALLDQKGEAVVTLPDWFEALNKDFRYQLTAVGAPGPGLYIAAEIKNNRFTIAGGTAGMKVSWQVTGIRHDPYAEKNRIVVEEDKPADKRGLYVSPAAYDKPSELGIAAEAAPKLEAPDQK